MKFRGSGRLLAYAEGVFGYAKNPTVGAVDGHSVARRVSELMGIGDHIPSPYEVAPYTRPFEVADAIPAHRSRGGAIASQERGADVLFEYVPPGGAHAKEP